MYNQPILAIYLQLGDIAQMNLDSLSLTCFIFKVVTQPNSLIPVISKQDDIYKHLVSLRAPCTENSNCY